MPSSGSNRSRRAEDTVQSTEEDDLDSLTQNSLLQNALRRQQMMASPFNRQGSSISSSYVESHGSTGGHTYSGASPPLSPGLSFRETSEQIDKLQKGNFDLRLKVQKLTDNLKKSAEGARELAKNKEKYEGRLREMYETNKRLGEEKENAQRALDEAARLIAELKEKEKERQFQLKLKQMESPQAFRSEETITQHTEIDSVEELRLLFNDSGIRKKPRSARPTAESQRQVTSTSTTDTMKIYQFDPPRMSEDEGDEYGRDSLASIASDYPDGYLDSIYDDRGDKANKSELDEIRRIIESSSSQRTVRQPSKIRTPSQISNIQGTRKGSTNTPILAGSIIKSLSSPRGTVKGPKASHISNKVHINGMSQSEVRSPGPRKGTGMASTASSATYDIPPRLHPHRSRNSSPYQPLGAACVNNSTSQFQTQTSQISNSTPQRQASKSAATDSVLERSGSEASSNSTSTQAEGSLVKRLSQVWKGERKDFLTAETVEGWLELELDSDSEKENEETIDDIEIIDNDFGEPCFIDLETWESKERLKRRRSGLEFSEAEVLKILEETEDEENYVKVWEV